MFPLLDPFTLTGVGGRRETPGLRGWAERKWGEGGRAVHLFVLCDNVHVTLERVHQVLDGQLLGDVRQVNEVFTVKTEWAEVGGQHTQVRPGEYLLPLLLLTCRCRNHLLASPPAW